MASLCITRICWSFVETWHTAPPATFSLGRVAGQKRDPILLSERPDSWAFRVLRLRLIIMTMLVATLGLLPALSHGIGSDSQRPFAIVIVGGLISDLVMGIFQLPNLYAWFASVSDRLPEPETEEPA
jgi:hypothetical protein